MTIAFVKYLQVTKASICIICMEMCIALSKGQKINFVVTQTESSKIGSLNCITLKSALK